MKQLQKSDLKVSKIYKLKAHNREYLYRISDMRTSMTLCNDGYLIIDTNHFNKISNISQSHDFADAKYIETKEKYEFYNATEEEKHWLETCIKENKFISYEEAMETFIPEYVECIKTVTGITIGKILPVKNNMIIDGTFNNYSIKAINIYKYFKPSTKEAYDAQFVVKEPEFVLPEKWYVKDISKNEIDIVCKYGNKMWSTPNYNCKTWKPTVLGKILIGNYSSGRPYFVNNDFSHNHIEITFDQFKQYVLKEQLEEPKDKILEVNHLSQATKVESSEGSIFKIGDKITVFTHDSPNKGKVFTIKGFRWNNAKTNICAVTELHTPNGIGLDKIELYIEPKVKIVDDFVLPENWYIKVTDDNKEVLQQYILNIHNLTMITLSNINYVAYSKWLNGINRTENKLGYGLISHLNLNPLPNIYRTVTYYNGEEITFEQFKKYVLKDE